VTIRLSSKPAIRPMPSALCRCSIATPPRQTAADGGYASRANLAAAKARGIADVAFHKKCGRAGIEAAISCFKRAYGAARCTWRGLDHFNAYIWSAEVAHNLVLFARLKPA